ncbi:MAG: DUF4870 domain-containing protein [Pseudonocardiaceae bacterium]
MNNPAGIPPRDDAMTTSTGLTPGISAMLSYALGAVSGLVVFLIEGRHREVRFHAAQSLLFSGVLTALYIAVTLLRTFLPWDMQEGITIVLRLAGLAAFCGWLVLLVSAYQLKHAKVPLVGSLAEKMADSQVD